MTRDIISRQSSPETLLTLSSCAYTSEEASQHQESLYKTKVAGIGRHAVCIREAY